MTDDINDMESRVAFLRRERLKDISIVAGTAASNAVDDLRAWYYEEVADLRQEYQARLKATHDQFGKDKCPNCGEPPTSVREENCEAYCEPCEREIFW